MEQENAEEERLSYRLGEVSRLTGISVTSLRGAIRAGRLKVVQVGTGRLRRRYVVLKDDLRSFLMASRIDQHAGRTHSIGTTDSRQRTSRSRQ